MENKDMKAAVEVYCWAIEIGTAKLAKFAAEAHFHARDPDSTNAAIGTLAVMDRQLDNIRSALKGTLALAALEPNDR